MDDQFTFLYSREGRDVFECKCGATINCPDNIEPSCDNCSSKLVTDADPTTVKEAVDKRIMQITKQTVRGD